MVASVFSQPVESLACCVTSIAEWQKRQARSAIALPAPGGKVAGYAARGATASAGGAGVAEFPGPSARAIAPSATSPSTAAALRANTKRHLVDGVVAVA